MKSFPVDFTQKAAQPRPGNGVGSPCQISARDLMADFEYAALDADETWIETTSGQYGQGRKLKLPALPSTGKHVLGCVDGTLQWIETEEC